MLIGPGAAVADAWSGGKLGTTGIALAFAFVIAAMVIVIGRVSGAHINPAVTLALWSRGRFPAARVLPYLAAQCFGAIVAAFVLRATMGNVGNLGATVPVIPVPAAVLLEFLMSVVLMLVVMAAVDGRAPAAAAPFAIGGTVGFCALVFGPATGASMNPARSLGPAVAGGVWTSHWLYWAAPIAGMLIGALAWDVLASQRKRPAAL